MDVLYKLKNYPSLKPFLVWLITPKSRPRPRLWVRILLTPFYYKYGKNVRISYFKSRLDLFPWHKFEIGCNSLIEDYSTISNGVGDLIIGNNCRIGIGSVVLGPVILGNSCGIGQNVFISGFNHGYDDADKDSNLQELVRKPIIIGKESHIGSNSVIVAGVQIGQRCQIGAGSVVTKDVPDYSVVAGNPARIIKRFDFDKNEWVKVSKV